MIDKHNLNISSKQDMPGGEYGNVHISGLGVIHGDLSCDSVKVSGSATFKGQVKTSEMKTSGSSKLMGALQTQELKVSGSLRSNDSIHCLGTVGVSGKLSHTQNIVANQLKVSGVLSSEGEVKANQAQISGKFTSQSLVVENATISGLATVKKSLNAQQLKVSGILTVGTSIEAEALNVTGRLNCDGFINAEKVQLEARLGSHFEEIGASEVKIYRYDNGYGIVGAVLGGLTQLFTGNKKVNGSLIEADQVYVENARIKKISGHDIVIGPDCEIGEIEYSGTLIVDKASTVKHSVMQ